MCLCGMLVTFLTVGSKEPKKKKKRQPKDWLYVGSQSLVLEKAWQLELRAAGHSVPTGRKEREMNTDG